MGFPDFPVPEREKSYLSQAEILDFLNLYADYFNLRPLIKVRYTWNYNHSKLTASLMLHFGHHRQKNYVWLA